MAKNLKLTIKNTQIAEAINLGSLKSKLAKKKAGEAPEAQEDSHATKEKAKEMKRTEEEAKTKEEAPRIRARSKSAFAEGHPEQKIKSEAEEGQEKITESLPNAPIEFEHQLKEKTSEDLRKEIFKDELQNEPVFPPEKKVVKAPSEILSKEEELRTNSIEEPPGRQKESHPSLRTPPSRIIPSTNPKLGPTGRHVKDLLPPPKVKKEEAPRTIPAQAVDSLSKLKTQEEVESKSKVKAKTKGKFSEISETDENAPKKGVALTKVKEFRDLKPAKRQESAKFDVRDRHGLRDTEEDQRWRKKRSGKQLRVQEDVTIRPTFLKIRLPISIKDLASEMKLKASQLISKLFLQGVIATLNDLLDDDTTVQLLGQEFGCEITVDTSEQERIRITGQTVKEEIQASLQSQLMIRPPVVAFMGHVDHGKTSLIDAIRKSNRAAGEAGAITQHIGAFRCSTPVGDITILDTPGHEAFSSMRARGADVTDIVVLVVAGDEGIRQQTLEAIQHAKAAKVTIVVAINKSDKPNFNAENVYRQLAEHELLPEAWGGQTITINCSAVTGAGIESLLEMLALQAEVLELHADPHSRARGRVFESEMHKGMGAVTTVLVQNGTLKLGDALVFDQYWGRVKTMQDEYGRQLEQASPSTPVEITGLSGLPEAGQEFIVVKNEREAREIAEVRMQGIRQSNMLLKKKVSIDNLFQQAADSHKKILNVVLRADVQGSLEALKAALLKIESTKAELNIIFSGVGEVSESDVQLAAASKAVIIGFHTQIEGHADALVKQLGIQIRMHDIIYHAIDEAKVLLAGLLDRIAQETDKGKAQVKAVFKSSHFGTIAGCLVTEGTIHRNYNIRQIRKGELIWKGPISSLKRVKDDVREVQKGLECGIVLGNHSDVQEDDILEAFEVTYISQEL